MKVLKFGGTSVGSASNIIIVKEILSSRTDVNVVVVSAFGGITDKLLNASRLAGSSDNNYKDELNFIEERHIETVHKLFSPQQQTKVLANVKLMLDELADILKGVYLLNELTTRVSDKILSFGERLSSYIIANYIENSVLADARDFIKTDRSSGSNVINFELTNQLIKKHLPFASKLAIVPGYIASNSNNEVTTLGRGGSDYTAAVIAAALDATAMEIWTDVDGFMTADPRVITKAYSIDKLSYIEAMELSHFGAKVIYPPTILPVYRKGIPILIKNTFNPKAKGTLITNQIEGPISRKIKGISSINDIVLITVQGIGMVGVTGISMRLFGALAKEDINVILISQASSENSISFAILPDKINQARMAIEQEFKREIQLNLINKVMIEEELSIIAIVGENMKHTTGVAGKLFNTLGRNGVNLVAIAQGASELNISFVVKSTSLRKTLNVIHESFFLSEYVELNLFLVGVGTVGEKLLNQLANQQPKLLQDNKLKIKLVGLTNTKKMIFDPEGLDITNYKKMLDHSEEASDMQEFKSKMIEMNMYNSVFVDCTASQDISDIYYSVLNANISVITANKIAASSEYKHYLELKNIAKSKGVKFLFETNVGAGLPIISTINDLIKSGDKILKLEAVLSGTLNFIVNTISEKIPLSETIRMAKEKGYSEPDPRIDLSGIDVVRKILILSRESGYEIERDDVKIRPFIPKEYLETPTLDEFWEKVKELDAAMEAQRKRLETENKRWRYVASMAEGKTNIELREVDSTHPFYNLEGSNNIILITTARYNEQPMIIKGYGAGASVTAAGVFADIMRVVNI